MSYIVTHTDCFYNGVCKLMHYIFKTFLKLGHNMLLQNFRITFCKQLNSMRNQCDCITKIYNNLSLQ